MIKNNNIVRHINPEWLDRAYQLRTYPETWGSSALQCYEGLKGPKGLSAFQCPHGPTHILRDRSMNVSKAPRRCKGHETPLVIPWAMGAQLLSGYKLQTYVESVCCDINLCGLKKNDHPHFNRTLMTEQNLKRLRQIQPYYFTVLPTGASSFLKKN